MMTEFGSDTKISDRWRVSGLLEICPKKSWWEDANETGEDYQALKAKVISLLDHQRRAITRSKQ